MAKREPVKPPPGVRIPPEAEPAPPRRGRPRSVSARLAVLEAAKALLAEGGLGAVTIEAVAARAGVGKPTIYRTWPNAHAVAMAALMEGEEADGPTRGARTAISTLRRQLRGIARVFSSRTGRSVTLMLASAVGETELSKAFRNHFILARREEGRALLRKAIERGELRGDLGAAGEEVALDLLYAPIFYRILVGHAPLDDAFVDAVVEQLVRGLGPPR
jgi:AcrR family transcriptional regulator